MELQKLLQDEIREGLYRITISGPRGDSEVSKVRIRPVEIKGKLLFQCQETVGTKEFHKNMTKDDVITRISDWMNGTFKQMQLESDTCTASVLVSKKGTMTIKNEDILPQLPSDREITILDFGCGKSYLTFAMYYYFRELKKLDVNIIGLDLKEDVIAICNGLAEKYGYEKLHFYQGDIASYTGRDEVDMVVTLHACDTATDYALEKAVKWNAKVILSVPCCQHELNRQIANKELYPIMDYGILKERMAALLTDGIRAKLLENAGYETQILEFIDMEHTPKNLLIRAVKRQEGSKKLPEELKVCMEAYHVKPTLADLLTEKEEP